jgi:hypothetical protein
MDRHDDRLTTVLTAARRDEEESLPFDEAERRLAGWGFQAHADLPDGPGPAFLLVALRAAPTLRHYDPDAVEYWATENGHGVRHVLSRATPMPLTEPFSWGSIRLVDRLGVTNDYVTFGGRLDAAQVDDAVIVAFASPAPILRRGGHSQGWDRGADAVGAFFGRLMVQVDFTPGFETQLADAPPLTRYAAFVRDSRTRCSRPGGSAALDEDFCRLMATEAARLRASAPSDWDAGRRLSPDDVPRPAGRCR